MIDGQHLGHSNHQINIFMNYEENRRDDPGHCFEKNSYSPEERLSPFIRLFYSEGVE